MIFRRAWDLDFLEMIPVRYLMEKLKMLFAKSDGMFLVMFLACSAQTVGHHTQQSGCSPASWMQDIFPYIPHRREQAWQMPRRLSPL